MTEVLVVSDHEDLTARRVVERLSDRVLWFDLADFPLRLRIHATYGDSQQNSITYAGATVDLEAVMSVYYRRPTLFALPAETTPVDRQFLRAEARAGFGGVLTSLRCRWVNHPARIADADLKPAQLRLAQSLGMTVPRGLITNDPGEAAKFAASMDHSIVYKPLGSLGLYDDEGAASVLFTNTVDRIDPDDPSLRLTAHLFQERVPKACELRVTVVGRRCFAVAITTSSEAAQLDWRSDPSSVSYAPVELPASLTSKLHAYLDALGLVFGAFDLIVTPDGDYVFLECNANGQWLWLEEELGLPISAAITRTLIGESD